VRLRSSKTSACLLIITFNTNPKEEKEKLPTAKNDAP
jgi:hypothetical protein